jgi:hypothetical protein
MTAGISIAKWKEKIKAAIVLALLTIVIDST